MHVTKFGLALNKKGRRLTITWISEDNNKKLVSC